MKIVIDQFEPRYKDLGSNSSRILNTIKNYEADIYTFPELCLSGYLFTQKEELSKYAIAADHPFINILQYHATSNKKIISVGFAEKANNYFYDSAITIFPDPNQTFVYRKTHLFYKESMVFEEGDTGFKVVECNQLGIRVGTMICYDWRFPEAARTLSLGGADIILSPSNLVTSKWQNALSTRAVENKVFIAVANRVGKETLDGETLEFNGESTFYNPEGEVVARASSNRKSIIMAEFDYTVSADKSINQYNDIIGDRRPEMYAL